MVLRFIVCDHVSFHPFVENVMWNYFYCRTRKIPFNDIWGLFFLDSGGFTCQGKYPPLSEYMTVVERLNPDIFACQDLMCEPFFMKITGKSINTHIRQTVDSYINICEFMSRSDFDYGYCIPVLQGWTLDDYSACIDEYYSRGIHLDGSYVALGSVCKRTGPEAQQVVDHIRAALPSADFHGFGVNRSVSGLFSSDTALSRHVKGNKTTASGLHHVLHRESLRAGD